MNQQTKHTLSKADRLKSRKQISYLFNEGKTITIFPFRMLYAFLPSTGHELQAGFSVPSRHFKKAVERNRIKRLMRETYRLQKATIPVQTGQALRLFFIYTGKEIPEYTFVFTKMKISLQKLAESIGKTSAP